MQPDNFTEIRTFFEGTLAKHGPVPAGLDWKDQAAADLRYQQVLKVVDRKHGFSLVDFGCGYGGLCRYMDAAGFTDYDYLGVDVSPAMIEAAQVTNPGSRRSYVAGDHTAITNTDFVVASGVFNKKLTVPEDIWTNKTLQVVSELYKNSRCGIAVNFLTSYSDPDRRRSDLFYPSPESIFSFGKSLSQNVSLLHDYGLYDFTLIVRRHLPSQDTEYPNE